MNIHHATQRTFLSVATVALACLTGSAAGEDLVAPPATDRFKPGTETRVDLPTAKSWAIVYVPKDYVPGRKWPVVVNYHTRYADNQWQKAQTKPFRKLTGGKGYVVLGMNYTSKTFYQNPANAPVDAEIRALAEAIGILEKDVEISRKMIFPGGVYFGACTASLIAESMLPDTCGLVLLSGGRLYLNGGKPPAAELIRGKPVFVGVGSKDGTAGDWTRQGAASYRQFGARVTLEVWPGQGFGEDIRDSRLRQWLDTNGPLRFADTDLKTAQRLERSGRVGQAYCLYQLLANISPTNKSCKRASNAAATIERHTRAQLALANKAVDEKNYAKAVNLLKVISDRLSGCEFGDQATARLRELQSDPIVAELIVRQELNTRAEALEAQATAAEADKNYARALKIYQRYVEAFAGADHYAQIREHYQSLRDDPNIVATARNQSASRECKRLMSLATGYTKAGLTDKAQGVLAEIIEKYPDTDWAKQASARRDQIQRDSDAH